MGITNRKKKKKNIKILQESLMNQSALPNNLNSLAFQKHVLYKKLNHCYQEIKNISQMIILHAFIYLKKKKKTYRID
jgi:hypothetical protein